MALRTEGVTLRWCLGSRDRETREAGVGLVVVAFCTCPLLYRGWVESRTSS